MPISFAKLLDDCLLALGDSDASTWERATVISPWAVEAILQFPILRPKLQVVTMLTESHTVELNDDFREMISVEHPVSQEPPQYLLRKNHFDPDFYTAEIYYDYDWHYSNEAIDIYPTCMLWTSKMLAAGEVVNIHYLANHETGLEDDVNVYISVPDEYEHILIAYVVMKGYRERLGVYMQDPTAHQWIIQQMTRMVEAAEKNYKELVTAAMSRYNQSKVLPHFGTDKFDRVY